MNPTVFCAEWGNSLVAPMNPTVPDEPEVILRVNPTVFWAR
jgi:hypothetical protein